MRNFLLLKSRRLIVLINLILFFGIFLSVIFPPTDPDLGWHLKYGEHFFKSGSILRDNTFSLLMPDYKWNNSSWLTDLISFQVFNIFGFVGLSLLGAFIITLTFFFIGKAAKLDVFEKSIIFPILVYFLTPVHKISFRGQLISLLLTAILYFILSKYEANKKIVLLTIPLFTLWSNLHGQFLLGLAIFGLWICSYSIKEVYLNYKFNIKKLIIDNKYLYFSGILSLFSPILNPFGLGVYQETIQHIDDPMQKYVTEYLPSADFSQLWWQLVMMGAVMGFGFLLLGSGKKRLNLAPFYLPSIILYFLSYSVRRYAWTFYYSSIFLLKPVVSFFKPPTEKYATWFALVSSLAFLTFVISFKYPFEDIRSMNWNEYCKKTVKCSPTAANEVIKYNLNNNTLFTAYDYGGYLIWNFPQIKPTIDGRMHLWRDEDNFSAFEYFYPIEQNVNDIDKSRFNAVLTSKSKPVFRRMIQLEDEGKWQVVHIDKYSALFIRIPEEKN